MKVTAHLPNLPEKTYNNNIYCFFVFFLEQLVSLVELMGASTVQHPSLFPYNEGRKSIIVAQADARDLSYDYDGE